MLLHSPQKDFLKQLHTYSYFQGIFKCAIMLRKKHKINKLLHTLNDEFWSVELLEESTQKEFKMRFVYLKLYLYTFLCTAFGCCGQYFVESFVESNFELPLRSLYPFDIKKVPVYEMIYMWQAYCNFSIVVLTICYYDMIVLPIMANIVTQFYILQNILKDLGVDRCNEKLMWRNNKFNQFKSEGMSNRHLVLMKCIQHHQFLTEYVCLIFLINYIYLKYCSFLVFASILKKYFLPIYYFNLLEASAHC